MGFLNKAEYDQYKANQSVNDSNFNSLLSLQTMQPDPRSIKQEENEEMSAIPQIVIDNEDELDDIKEMPN